MYPINAFSAAPHMPHDRRTELTPSRPESLASVLMLAAAGAHKVEVFERNGEIFIELLAA